MKSLADLKRMIKVGVMITLTHAEKPHKRLGTTRPVSQANTVGFAMDTDGVPSHLDWPKASALTFYPDHPDTFSVGVGTGNQLTYRIEPTQTGLQ